MEAAKGVKLKRKIHMVKAGVADVEIKYRENNLR
jgi:hypothetical protein